MLTLDPGHRIVGLDQGIAGQAGRQEYRALVDEQVRHENAQPIEQDLGIVEVGERSREVTTGMSRQPAFLARRRVIRLLTAFGPQGLDPGVVSVGPVDVAHGEVRRGPVVQGTRFPDQVARVRQQVNGGPRVPQSLGVATHDPQSVGLADQNPAGWDTAAVTQRRVEDSQSMPRLPGQEQGHAQAREDVGFPVHVSGLARKPLRGLQLADCFTDITEVPEYHADRLVRDRGLRRGGVPSQHRAGGGEGFRWLR